MGMLETTDTTAFYGKIKEILDSARAQVYTAVNTAMVKAYWLIGKSIVERQGGAEHAEYGKGLIKELALRLTADYGKGFTVTNLMYMRQFYLTYPIHHTLCDKLTWSHYRHLIKVENEKARLYYTEECVKAKWSVRQLERQINSFYYERILASRDKVAVAKEIATLEPPLSPRDFIKDPYVLEFVGLKPSAHLYERDLESALISYMQEFLLELGRGFSFVARQKHIDLNGEHFYIDLVFYNYILKCFVLIDLKTTKLTYQDIGQMDGYVRLFDELQKRPDDNPTIGIILCSEKNEAVARYSALNGSNQLFASKYMPTLPSAEELEKYLMEERRRYDERMAVEKA